jgi:hypothetical protein
VVEAAGETSGGPLRDLVRDVVRDFGEGRPATAVTCENVNVPSSYACGQSHCAGAPQLHVALPRRARQRRDGAQLDDGDVQRRDDEPRLSDDAPGPGALVLVPSYGSSVFL